MSERLIVIKIGSSTLLNDAGALDREFIASVVAQLAELRSQGNRIVLVSSGAVASGREQLGFTDRPKDMATLQACASVGQAQLTHLYATELARLGLSCGQILLTRRDVVDRNSYLNARATFDRLLDLGVIPIVNENDTISTAELNFGDNDMLGAIVSAMLDADIYVICSDIEGLYSANPHTHPDATLITEVEAITPEIFAMAGESTSSVGTGGMASKLRAAHALQSGGIETIICKGRTEHVLVDCVEGSARSTHFKADSVGNHRAAKRLWIGLAEMAQGRLVIDEGATAALKEMGASLLPVGIQEVLGTFDEGAVVSVYTQDDRLVARGVTRYSSEQLNRYKGLKLEVIQRFYGDVSAPVVVHRDELLIF